MSESPINPITRHQIYLQRLGSQLANEFEPYIKRLDKAVREILTRGDISSKRELDQVLRELKQAAGDEYGAYVEQLEKELEGLADYESNWNADLLKQITAGIAVTAAGNAAWRLAKSRPIQTSDDGQSTLLGALLAGFVDSNVDRLLGVVRNSYYQGDTQAQMIQKIRGTRKNKFKDGLFSTTARYAGVIARTASNHVSTTAKMATYNKNKDVLEGWEFVATLDHRTSSVCFTGATPVGSLCGFEKISRAKYVGDILTVTTSRGHKFECTPNHPILTSAGWIAADEIDPSNHVIYTTSRNVDIVGGNETVGVPLTFAELFDSASELSVFGVKTKCSTANDFYGDGKFLDGDIAIVSSDGFLSSGFEPVSYKLIKDEALGLVGQDGLLSADGSSVSHVLSSFPAIKPPKLDVVLSEGIVKPTLRTPQFNNDIARSPSGLEQRDGLSDSFMINEVSRDINHESELFEQICNSGGAGAVFSSDLGGGDSFISVEADNVVSVRREFGSHNVYTLETSLGYYIAGGSVVKNCRFNDSKVFDIGEGPLPPLHFGCRSTAVPVVKEQYSLLKFADKGTRASSGASGGKQTKDQGYYDWLSTQPKWFQQDVLGKSKTELFRNGGLTTEEFRKLTSNNFGDPLTLPEIEQKDRQAWGKAGLST